jgi:polar amino acid transport system ATP-binding protein
VSPPVLEIRGVTKAYGDRPVLRGIDLAVGEHEAVALIGASGSGKSTLLRCVSLLEELDDGTVHLDGEEITDPRIDADRVRSRFGVVFQAFNLFPHLSVLDNVTLAPRVVRGTARREAEDRARALLDRVGLADKAKEYPDRLSGGQQQRAAIARALAMEPQLMLFDEPTSALDPELVGEVLRVIRNLAEEGRTMLIVTHEIGFAREVSSRTVFLHQGRIEEEGPPKEVFGNPRSERLRQFLASHL